ncbi:hypothetical protein AVEN_247945-1 [Araneus ventricosus]|uniref:Uncharacterized protein n=1 Tax=Araneus ventricosus TaxID=182803 RepID=A0A4Y2CI83_ARAVE|nr:hypothetical protein AVEN_247945-1 [Araneus ventricosus]
MSLNFHKLFNDANVPQHKLSTSINLLTASLKETEKSYREGDNEEEERLHYVLSNKTRTNSRTNLSGRGRMKYEERERRRATKKSLDNLRALTKEEVGQNKPERKGDKTDTQRKKSKKKRKERSQFSIRVAFHHPSLLFTSLQWPHFFRQPRGKDVPPPVPFPSRDLDGSM